MFTEKYTCENIKFEEVRGLLEKSGLKVHSIEKHQKAFENSYKVIFIYDNDKLIGTGRMISDGSYQGAIYDVAVSSDYQGKGLGKRVVEYLIENENDLKIILYAAQGKETFYQKFNFEKLERAMVRNVVE